MKGYLYRLVADRHDAEHLAHDSFVKGFEKIAQYKELSSFKTWMFAIATNLAHDHLRKITRWKPDAQDLSKRLAETNASVYDSIINAGNNGPYSSYEIIEHIDFCFTCISKVLPLDQQVALLLKDVYDFSISDIQYILSRSVGVVKHLLIDARKTMRDVFEGCYSLVNKNGACQHCSELNAVFNPRQEQQMELQKLELVKDAQKSDADTLLKLRTAMIKNINPLYSSGADLQDTIMQCTRKAIGEID